MTQYFLVDIWGCVDVITGDYFGNLTNDCCEKIDLEKYIKEIYEIDIN